MSSHEKYDTHRKALALNLDHAIFGSFAEIGAGQEVARWFLRVGGASGTVAKSISAYDKGIRSTLWNRDRSEEHTSELQSLRHLVCRLLLEKKKRTQS